MSDTMNERTLQELKGLATRIQFCHYCYSRVRQFQKISIASPEKRVEDGGAIGLLATFYMYNYYSNLSELFNKLKDERELERLLKSTPEQRISLRGKLRHVVVHSVDAQELTDAFEGNESFSVLWSEELNIVTAYVFERLKKNPPVHAESFKQELLDVDKFVGMPGQTESIKQLMEEAYENQKKFKKALEGEGQAEAQ